MEIPGRLTFDAFAPEFRHTNLIAAQDTGKCGLQSWKVAMGSAKISITMREEE